MGRPPKVNYEGQKELAKVDEAFEKVTEAIASCDSLDPKVPVEQVDPYTKLSKRQMALADAQYVTPVKIVNRVEGGKHNAKNYFNEAHRPLYKKDWEWIKVVIENKESIGHPVEKWTAEWGCDPAMFWIIPTNRPVYIPRFVARSIKKCRYIQRTMESDETKMISSDNSRDIPTEGAVSGPCLPGAEFYGTFKSAQYRQRLDANLYSEKLD